ncbi:MAG: amino acid permease [Acidobacteria bacterium]|nr:amino acid permease [Acidobacteriota bacterium]
MQLLRVLGVAFGIAVTLGATLGVGILRTPGLVAAQTGSVWGAMLVWTLGAVFALISAVSLAELAIRLPSAGGFYVYAREVLKERPWGDAVAFGVGWCDCLGQAAAVAFAAVTAQDLLQLPGTAVGLVLLLTLLQWLGIRTASRIQQLISFSLALAFLVLVGAALMQPGAAPAPQPLRTTSLLAALVIALRSVIVAYDGWYGAIYFTEEVHNLKESLPRSMIMGVSVVALVYLAVNAALLHSLGLAGLSASAFPAMDAARKLFGPAGDRAITWISIAAMPSLMNAVILLCTRIVYAMGRDGVIGGVAHVNAQGTPTAALLASSAGIVALTMSGTFDRLLSLAGFFFAITYSTGYLSVFLMRRHEGRGPYSAWSHPWGTGIALALCVLFVAADVWNDPKTALQSAGLLAASYPVYRLSKLFTSQHTRSNG